MKKFRSKKLVVSKKKQLCSACNEEISTKKGSIEAHIESRKHVTVYIKEKLQLAIKRDADIAEALCEYDSSVHPVGEGFTEATRIYRVNVVTDTLAGLPVKKMDCFRALSEEHAFSVTSSTRSFHLFIKLRWIK